MTMRISAAAYIFELLCAGLFVCVFAAAGLAEEDKTTGNASLGVYNRYILRGYELSSHSVVVQPALTISYQGFSAGFWGNIDSDQRATPNFFPDRRGKAGFNERDLNLSYTRGFGKLSLTAGYYYYGLTYAANTDELFVTASYDMPAKPALAVYRDIDEWPGTYINLSLAHSISVYREMTLELGASAGYFSGAHDTWRTNSGAGGIYRAFHDGMVKAGIGIPARKDLLIQLIAQYWFPLSDRAERPGYNPCGPLDEIMVYGVNAAYGF